MPLKTMEIDGDHTVERSAEPRYSLMDTWLLINSDF